MEQSPLSNNTPRLCPRPSYKGKFLIWRAFACLFFAAWILTLAAAIYCYKQPRGPVTVIYPSRMSQP